MPEGCEPRRLAGFLPGQLDLRAYRGNPLAFVVEFFDVEGDPIDVSGWDFAAEVRDDYDGTLLASFSVLRPPLLPDSEIEVVLAPAETAVLQGTLVWDLKRTDEERAVLSGRIVAVPDVTEVP